MTVLNILRPGLTYIVTNGGQSVLVADNTMGVEGGMIVNPLHAIDQGINVSQELFVCLTGPALTNETNGTIRLVPGQSFLTPPTVNVWVNSPVSGHKFTAFFSSEYKAQYPPTIVPGTPESGVGTGEPGSPPFPPLGPTGLTTVLPSYLYQEYSDDDDLQGWVAAQNAKQQDFVDTFNALNLPFYPGPIVSNALLDWVGSGLYGMSRPALSSGIPNIMGPLNTYGYNWFVPMWLGPITNVTKPFGLNIINYWGPENIVIATDDLYRRILTWHFYKGDGKYFGMRWLKRRVWRFLYGNNGISNDYSWDPVIDGPHPPPMSDRDDAFIADTRQISIGIGVNRNVTIRFVLGQRTVVGGCLPNRFGCNGFGMNSGGELTPEFVDIQLNDIETTYVRYPPLPYMYLFKQSLESGVLEFPYQFNFTCDIG